MIPVNKTDLFGTNPVLWVLAVLCAGVLNGPGISWAGGGAASPPNGSGKDPASEERRLLLMKQDLDRDIERNKKILDEIDKKLTLYESLKSKNVRHLVRLYESMAPRTAASQINAMPKKLRLTLFSGMNPRKASRIMQYVDPQVAAEISAQMAGDAPARRGGQ